MCAKLPLKLQVRLALGFAGARGGVAVLTEVVRTPHSSNFSKEGVGALGVSMNSNSDSLPLVLWGFDIAATMVPAKLPLPKQPLVCGEVK